MQHQVNCNLQEVTVNTNKFVHSTFLFCRYVILISMSGLKCLLSKDESPWSYSTYGFTVPNMIYFHVIEGNIVQGGVTVNLRCMCANYFYELQDIKRHLKYVCNGVPKPTYGYYVGMNCRKDGCTGEYWSVIYDGKLHCWRCGSYLDRQKLAQLQ